MQENTLKVRENFIKARAQLDAVGYINLMREKSPDSLSQMMGGVLVINMIEGEKIIREAIDFLNLNGNPVGIHFYIDSLAKAVLDRIKN